MNNDKIDLYLNLVNLLPVREPLSDMADLFFAAHFDGYCRRNLSLLQAFHRQLNRCR